MRNYSWIYGKAFIQKIIYSMSCVLVNVLCRHIPHTVRATSVSVCWQMCESPRDSHVRGGQSELLTHAWRSPHTSFFLQTERHLTHTHVLSHIRINNFCIIKLIRATHAFLKSNNNISLDKCAVSGQRLLKMPFVNLSISFRVSCCYL